MLARTSPVNRSGAFAPSHCPTMPPSERPTNAKSCESEGHQPRQERLVPTASWCIHRRAHRTNPSLACRTAELENAAVQPAPAEPTFRYRCPANWKRSERDSVHCLPTDRTIAVVDGNYRHGGRLGWRRQKFALTPRPYDEPNAASLKHQKTQSLCRPKGKYRSARYSASADRAAP